MTSCEKAAKTVEDAIDEALRELQCSRDEVEIKVLDEGSKGFLGILGTKLARVLVSKKVVPLVDDIQVKPHIGVSDDNVVASGIKGSVVNVISEEDAKVVIDKAESFLADILVKMGIDASMERRFESGVLNVNLTGQNLGILIGKHGQTLDSLQYLVGLVANRGNKEGVGRLRIIIDAEGYRRRREQTLRSLAIRLADKVRREGRSAFLEPMSANERRIIHTTLQHNTFVTTHSEGEEPNRKVVISPKGYGRYGNNGRVGAKPNTTKPNANTGSYNR